MPRPLDEILGIKKTASVHDLKVGERVRLVRAAAFEPGREGEITSLDQWNRVIVKLDCYPNLEFPFHHMLVERIVH